MSRLEIAFWVAVGLVVIVMVMLDATSRPTPPDLDRMTDSERAKALKKKREAAAAWMKQHGIRSLCEGHEGGRTGWRKVNPMVAGGEEQPEPIGNVVRLRGQR